MLGAAEALAGMLEWSGPVVFDCLYVSYSRRIKDEARACSLAHRHAQEWRALIAGDERRFDELRRDLVAALAAFGVEDRCLLEADVCVIAELYEIAVARFGRSTRIVNAYREALTEIAARLSPADHRVAA